MGTVSRKNDELITGVPDFHGQRLNILQIGLGTFGTFFHNLTASDKVYSGVAWLLEATSNSSKELLGVGVEPVPEHARRLHPIMRSLPNTTVVQAAITRRGQPLTLYVITPEQYSECLKRVEPVERQLFDDSVLYLRNMSCVGQVHPSFQSLSMELQGQYGVKVEMEPIQVRGLSYCDLCRTLRFSGVEVLMIDAEGHDCQILLSMIEYCSTEDNSHAWPDVIQFETMGHSNLIDGGDAEGNIFRTLRECGYLIASVTGGDTQLVRAAALEAESRIQHWVEGICCDRCDTRGLPGMPFHSYCSNDTFCMFCRACNLLPHIFWPSMPVYLPHDVGLISVATDGTSIWGLCVDGSVCCNSDGSWHKFHGCPQQISLSTDGYRVWAADEGGLVRYCDVWMCDRWTVLSAGPNIRHISVYRLALWCTDSSDGIHVYSFPDRQWHTVRGRLRMVTVSADGSHVWGVNGQEEVYYRAGFDSSWVQVPGKLRQVAVSGDGQHVWGVSADNKIFYWTNEEWVS